MTYYTPPTTVKFSPKSKIESITLRYSNDRNVCAIIVKPQPNQNHDLHEFWDKMSATPVVRPFANRITLSPAEKEWHAVERTRSPAIQPAGKTNNSIAPCPGVVAILNETPDDYPWNYSEMHCGGRIRHSRHRISRHSKTREIVVNMGNDFNLPNYWGGHTLEREYHGPWTSNGVTRNRQGTIISTDPETAKTSVPAESNGHVTIDHAAVITDIAVGNLPNVAAKTIRAMSAVGLLDQREAKHAIAELKLPVNDSKLRKTYLNTKRLKYAQLEEDRQNHASRHESNGRDKQ